MDSSRAEGGEGKKGGEEAGGEEVDLEEDEESGPETRPGKPSGAASGDGGDTTTEDEEEQLGAEDGEEDLIGEADNIEQGIDTSMLRIARMHGRLEILVEKAKWLRHGAACMGLPNALVKGFVGSDEVLCTSVKKRQRNPSWRELFWVNVCHEAQRLTLRVVHEGRPDEGESLGQVSFSVAQVLAQGQGSSGIQGEFPLSRRRKHIENLDTFGGAWAEDRKEKWRRRKTSKHGWLSFRLRFIPAPLLVEKQLSIYNVKNKNPKLRGKRLVEQHHPHVVPHTYFRPHRGDHYVLYQSAHQPGLATLLPEVTLDGDQPPFRARSCWGDLSHALNEAERFICITGWTFDPHTRLVRVGADAQSKPSIGTVLREKASEGVLVFIMIWDDAGAPAAITRARGPALGEKESDPVAYFRGSKVCCVRVKRQHKVKSVRVLREGEAIFAHAQSAIVMDIKPSNAAKLQIKHRRHKNAKVQAVTAFVGGLDIAAGRYDDPEKTLFALKRAYQHDVVQPCLPPGVVSPDKGPRMPWQDLHTRITGASAVDVLKNFIERWHKQVGWTRYSTLNLLRGDVKWVVNGNRMKRLLRLLKNSPGEGALPQSFLGEAKDQIKGRAETVLRLGGESDVRNARNNFGMSRQNVDEEGDEDDDLSDLSDEELHDLQEDLDELIAEERARSGSWNAAFSTDSREHADKVVQVLRSVDMDAARLDKRTTAPHVCFHKDLKVDDSMHRALVHHIRGAQHFIYLETSALVGSSHRWAAGKTAGANNLVPAEIAEKIVEKIAAGKPFHAYVVVSLHPLGPPDDPAVQQTLHWQHQTVQMMYRCIAEAIKEAEGPPAEEGEESTDSEGEAKKQQKGPEDYLSIFFLGNREAGESHKLAQDAMLDPEQEAAAQAAQTTDADDVTVAVQGPRNPENYAKVYSDALTSRRFMINVNSNLLIVDDAVAVIGSGGINQRTLSGIRDTSLGVSVFEASKLATKEGTPRGQIYGLRMSLWAEHLGPSLVDQPDFDPTMLQRPSADDCVAMVRGRAEESWAVYTAVGEPENVPSHLIRYPYAVAKDGTVTAREGFEILPGLERSQLLGSRTGAPLFATT